MHVPFTARYAGRLTVGPVNEQGRLTVRIDGALSGATKDHLEILIHGIPLQDGGVAMEQSRVRMGTTTPLYHGEITSLDGTRVVAALRSAHQRLPPRPDPPHRPGRQRRRARCGERHRAGWRGDRLRRQRRADARLVGADLSRAYAASGSSASRGRASRTPRRRDRRASRLLATSAPIVNAAPRSSTALGR